jgi:hypothetical protein
MHENLAREYDTGGGSDKSFGIVFAVVFLIVSLLPLLHGGSPRLWALALAAAFLIVALTRPGLLAPLNRLWTKFGLLLHKVVNPLVMGLLFFATVTPIGLLMRLFGKDPLRLKIDRQAESYWIDRVPPGPSPESIKNQF